MCGSHGQSSIISAIFHKGHNHRKGLGVSRATHGNRYAGALAIAETREPEQWCPRQLDWARLLMWPVFAELASRAANGTSCCLKKAPNAH